MFFIIISGLPNILILSLVRIVLYPSIKNFEPQINLGLSFWLSSVKSLKVEIPFDLAATRKIIKNSSIALELYFVGQLIALRFFELLIIISPIFHFYTFEY